MAYYSIQGQEVRGEDTLPQSTQTFQQYIEQLSPTRVTIFHQQIQTWGKHNLSPGPMLADRIHVGDDDTLYFEFVKKTKPQPLTQIGPAPDLAGWLVLLDKFMETYVVIARARTLWTPAELAGALSFTTLALLPKALVHTPPDNWHRVAQALAIAVADGPLNS